MRIVPIKIRSELELDAQRVTPAEAKRLLSAFSYSNPQFYKLQKMGRWVGNTPRTIETHRVIKNGFDGISALHFPRGAAARLDRAAAELGIDLDFQDDRLTLDDCDFDIRPMASPIRLREDQEEIVEQILERENGLVRAATGCLAGDTVIGVHRGGKGFKLRIDQLVHRFNGGRIQGRAGATWDPETPTMVRSEVGGFVRLHQLKGAVVSGVREVYEVKTAGGRSLKATLDHRFKTPAGWRRLGELSMGDCLLVNIGRPKAKTGAKRHYRVVCNLHRHPYSGRRNVRSGHSVPLHRIVAEAGLNGLEFSEFVSRIRLGGVEGLVFLDPKEFHVHHQDEDPLNNSPENLLIMKAGDHHRQHGKEGGWKHVTERVGEDPIVEIRRVGFEKTYDLEMDGEPRNFLANGIVVHNSGKTEVVLEAIRRAAQPALVVVWSKALLDQWVERIHQRWGWPIDRIGQIGGGKFRLGDITVAMHQSIAPRITNLRGLFGFVACDEVHRWAAKTFREIVGEFPARFRIGVSADERRKDGLEDITRDIFGPVLAEVGREQLIRDGRIASVEISVVPTGHKIGPEIQKQIDAVPSAEQAKVIGANYVKVLTELVHDDARNDLAGRLAAAEATEGRSVLIFTERVEHAFEIARVVSTRYQVPCGTLVGGATNKAAFEETRARLYEGSLRVAVGTSCVYEGFDVPRLAVGIVASPSAANKQRLEQQIGRLRRLFPGKLKGRLYYLWDEALFPSHLRRIEGYYGRRLVSVYGE